MQKNGKDWIGQREVKYKNRYIDETKNMKSKSRRIKVAEEKINKRISMEKKKRRE